MNGHTIGYNGNSLLISDAATIRNGTISTNPNGGEHLNITGDASFENIDILSSNLPVNISGDVIFNNVSITAGDMVTNSSSITLQGNLELGPSTTLYLTSTGVSLSGPHEITGAGSVSFGSVVSPIAGTTVENITFDVDVLVRGNSGSSTMIGGGWTLGNSLTIQNGATLEFEAGSNPVANNGSINLMDTGTITFDSGNMATDLENPIALTLTEAAQNQVVLSTNYGRNINYADASTDQNVVTAGTFIDLGTGQHNLEITANQVTPGDVTAINYSFDGSDTITIIATASGNVNETVTLTVRDKYADEEVYETITFTITSSDGGATVEVAIQ